MTIQRRNISKKLRFEVFKRDSFTCQYCGRKAPDVILEVDHINPVAVGGTNEILNLATSCKECNSGKGARLLKDQPIIEKQREQLEDLQDRREQLDLMLRWRKELAGIKDEELAVACEAFSKHFTGRRLNENGKNRFSRLIKTYGLSEVLDVIEISAQQYLIYSNGLFTEESFDNAYKKIEPICKTRRAEAINPEIRDVNYIAGICRKRFDVPFWKAKDLIATAIDRGASIQKLKDLACKTQYWNWFRSNVQDFIDSQIGGQE